MPRSIQDLQLKKKFFLMLTVSLLLLAPPLVLLHIMVLYPTYDAIEKNMVRTNMKRVLGSIQKEITRLDNVCHTWTLGYDAGGSCGIWRIKEKAVYRSFASGEFDMLCLLDRHRVIIVREGYDTATGARRIPSVFASSAAMTSGGMLDASGPARHRLGIIRTEYGFMITSVQPVFTRGNDGTPMGYLVMGRYLEKAITTIAANKQKNRFSIIDADGSLSALQAGALKQMRQQKTRVFITDADEDKYIYYLIPDIHGNHSILIEESFPSVISDARKVLKASFIVGIIVISLIQYIIWVLLGRYVVRPIDRLKKQINTIAEGNYRKESKLERNDEIGMLSHFIDSMAQTIHSRNEELKTANSKLERLSITDALTGIYNRRHFDEVMKSEWNRAGRSGSPLSLIMCDVDFFKKYNDMYGHGAGDECLVAVAHALKSMIRRDGDKLFRYGGEEFVAVLPNTPLDAAAHIAASFLSAVARISRPHKGSPDYGIVTLSAGVASFVPEKGSEYKHLIGLADSALYRSKENGRNRLTSAEETDDGEIVFAEHA